MQFGKRGEREEEEEEEEEEEVQEEEEEKSGWTSPSWGRHLFIITTRYPSRVMRHQADTIE